MVGRAIITILDALTILGVGVALWLVYEAVLTENPMQLGAISALALACGGLPYMLSGIAHRSWQREQASRKDT